MAAIIREADIIRRRAVTAGREVTRDREAMAGAIIRRAFRRCQIQRRFAIRLTLADNGVFPAIARRLTIREPIQDRMRAWPQEIGRSRIAPGRITNA